MNIDFDFEILYKKDIRKIYEQNDKKDIRKSFDKKSELFNVIFKFVKLNITQNDKNTFHFRKIIIKYYSFFL